MLRLAYVLVVFFTMTPAFIASLWMLEKLKLPGRRALCALLRVRIHVVGKPEQEGPSAIRKSTAKTLEATVHRLMAATLRRRDLLPATAA
jgi:hypothetical protein